MSKRKMVRPEDLLGRAEIMALAGFSRQRLHQLERGGDLPQPVIRLAAGPLWHRADVEAWLASR